MLPSPSIIAFIKSFEKCRLSAYKPTPNDKWTCGWGATGADISASTVWTKLKADLRFEHDLTEFSAEVTEMLFVADTSQQQFDAMVSLSYNVGAHALAESTLLKFHKAGDYVSAAAEFLKWDKQAGKELDGLLRRRKAEARIYKDGIYA